MNTFTYANMELKPLINLHLRRVITGCDICGNPDAITINRHIFTIWRFFYFYYREVSGILLKFILIQLY